MVMPTNKTATMPLRVKPSAAMKQGVEEGEENRKKNGHGATL
jgi:hypothetical protein